MYSVELNLLLLSDTWQLQLHDFPLWRGESKPVTWCAGQFVRPSPARMIWQDPRRKTASGAVMNSTDPLRTWEVHFSFSAKKGTHFVANMWNVRVLEWIPLAQAPRKPNLSAWFLCPTDWLLPHRISALAWGMKIWHDPFLDVFWAWEFFIQTQNDLDISSNWVLAIKFCFSCHRFSRNPWLTGTIDATPESGSLVPHRWNWKFRDLPSQLCQRCAKICQNMPKCSLKSRPLLPETFSALMQPGSLEDLEAV